MSRAAGKYHYAVGPEEEGQYLGQCFEFPSLSHVGLTPIEALEGILLLVADVLEDLAQKSEPIPEPLASVGTGRVANAIADYVSDEFDIGANPYREKLRIVRAIREGEWSR